LKLGWDVSGAGDSGSVGLFRRGTTAAEVVFKLRKPPFVQQETPDGCERYATKNILEIPIDFKAC
jgi:hypothetical protein